MKYFTMFGAKIWKWQGIWQAANALKKSKRFWYIWKLLVDCLLESAAFNKIKLKYESVYHGFFYTYKFFISLVPYFYLWKYIFYVSENANVYFEL